MWMRTLIQCSGLGFMVTVAVACSQNFNPPAVADQVFSVDENSPAGTIVGVVIAYDLDEGQSVSFEIARGNDQGTFDIDPAGGHLSVVDPQLLDYELHSSMILSVLVTDDHPRDPMASMATVTVDLVDLNEFAPVIEDQVFEISENPARGALVGIIQASDQDVHQGLDLTLISGNESGFFALDGQTGTLTVNDPVPFVYELNPQFLLTLQVRDLHLDSKTDTGVITVNVKPD